MPRPRGKGPDGPARGTFASRKKPPAPAAKSGSSTAGKGPPAPREDGQQRIAKLLARAGIASRRGAEAMIAEGRVSVNGRVIDTPALTVTAADRVAVDGRPVAEPAPARLWRYHKPAGLVTTAADE